MVPSVWVGSLVPDALPTSPLQSATTNSVPGQMSSVFSSPHSRRRISDDQRPPCHNVEDTAFPPAALATTGPGSSRAKVRPLPPPPETNPRTLRETPGPRNRTKPANGGGGRRGVAEDSRDGELSEGAESPNWPFVYPSAPRNFWARKPRPMPRASRGPEDGPCQVSSLAPASDPQPQAQCPSRALSPTLAQTSVSGTSAASLSTADAETPLTSRFPEAPGADCFRSAGPGGGERRSPALPWRCAGDGGGAALRQ